VIFSPSSGPDEEYGKVAGSGSCTGMQFYYDNNSNPTKAILCPDLCDHVASDAQGEVRISMDCYDYQ
jgi:hypothetical protein